MFVVWLTRAGHLNSTELLRYKVLQLYNALRLCGAVRQIVRKENYMNNFRKRIGHLLCLCFTLAILVTCFMASGITAQAVIVYSSEPWSATRSCKAGCDCTVYSCMREIVAYNESFPNIKNYRFTSCSNCGHEHPSGGGSSGGGSYVPSHTHNYSTTWGGWRKISSCRFPG